MTTIHFNALPLKDTANEAIKKGLIFYSTTDESPHVDSRKVSHDFPPDKVIKLVENTNKHFETTELGIPVLTEHRKDVNNVVGFIESPLEAKVITEDYTKGNPKLKHLLGRIGVFVNDVKIKSSEIIEKMNQGLAKSVSAGIDLDSFSIKELSLVALPAIPNVSLYSYYNQSRKKGNMKRNRKNYLLLPRESNFALSIDEALSSSQTLEQQREEAQKVFTAFLEVIESANEIDEEEMASMGIQDPSEVIQAAIDDLGMKLGDMFLGMPTEEAPPTQPVSPVRPGTPTRKFNTSNDVVMFYTGQGYTAEFGYRKAISGAFRQLRTRNVAGKSVGQIGSQFARKIGNATRGKFASIGRGLSRVGKAVTGGGFTKELIPKASQNQLNKQIKQKNKFGRLSTNPKPPKRVSNPDLVAPVKKPKI